MKGFYRIRLVFGEWTIQYFTDKMKNIKEDKFDSYHHAKIYADDITDYIDADKSDLPVDDSKSKSGNLA